MHKELYILESEKLFSEWENDPFHDKKSFFRDGIVDYKYWDSVPIKILFLLKEAYTLNGKAHNYTEDISESAPYKNWWRLTQWAYAIQQVLQHGVKPHFPNDLLNNQIGNWKKGNELLMSSALVNVKKSKGNPNSNPRDLMNYALHDRQRLKSQIDLINPDVVYCAYTFELYKIIYINDGIKLFDNSSFIFNHQNRLIIKYFHFSRPGYDNKDLYDHLCDELVKIKR